MEPHPRLTRDPRRDGAGERGRIAVVVPIRNEEKRAPSLVDRLRPVGARHEVVIVDGDSDDGGAALLGRRGLTVERSARGRGRQMNRGARATTAPIVLFLHADTTLPDGALDAVARAVDGGAGFGCFRVRIDATDPRLRLAAQLINLRSRLVCSATGDQAIFVRRDLFERVGGFPEVDLCEDLGLMRRLRGRAPFRLLDLEVTTSARRWEHRGVVRTVALMWLIRCAYHLGVDPSRLTRLYPDVR